MPQEKTRRNPFLDQRKGIIFNPLVLGRGAVAPGANVGVFTVATYCLFVSCVRCFVSVSWCTTNDRG